eukprot:10300273-Lingulodinium_polyedra.AAC.1
MSPPVRVANSSDARVRGCKSKPSWHACCLAQVGCRTRTARVLASPSVGKPSASSRAVATTRA